MHQHGPKTARFVSPRKGAKEEFRSVRAMWGPPVWAEHGLIAMASNYLPHGSTATVPTGFGTTGTRQWRLNSRTHHRTSGSVCGSIGLLA